MLQEQSTQHELLARGQELEYIFQPRSIALVGITSDPTNFVGLGFLKGLLELGFPGPIYPVNPKASEIHGLKAYPNVREIPGPVDHVTSLIPAHLTPQLIEDCGAKGVRVVHLFTAGFAETGEREGERLQAELLVKARRYGMRILGPNCLGLHCPGSGITYEMHLPKGAKKSGGISFLSQSGTNATELIQAGPLRGIHCNKLVSYGNALDLNESDFLENFAADPKTEVIAAYIEGIKDGPRFWRALREAARRKPVIVLKGGRTPAGTRALNSHSGSMAGSEDIWKTLLKQAGAIRVYTLDELADLLVLFSHLRPFAGRNAALFCGGGGTGVEMADLCEAAGLVVPTLPMNVQKQLREFTSLAGTSVRNPVDANMYGAPQLSRTVEIVAACPDVDFLIIQQQLGIGFFKVEAKAMFDLALEATVETAARIAKPAVIILRHRGSREELLQVADVQERCVQAGVVAIPCIERAALALSRFITFHASRNGIPHRN